MREPGSGRSHRPQARLGAEVHTTTLVHSHQKCLSVALFSTSRFFTRLLCGGRARGCYQRGGVSNCHRDVHPGRLLCMSSHILLLCNTIVKEDFIHHSTCVCFGLFVRETRGLSTWVHKYCTQVYQAELETAVFKTGCIGGLASCGGGPAGCGGDRASSGFNLTSIGGGPRGSCVSPAS